MTPDRLAQLLDQFRRRRIAVLGDYFLDKYLEFDPKLAETSLETGRVAHQVVAVRRGPGAAGTVVNNLSSLGAARLLALGVVGDDGDGFDLRKGLEALKCNTEGLLATPEIMTPTYLKPREFGVQGLQGEASRYDTKNRRPMPKAMVDRLARRVEQALAEVDALIIMDQVDSPDCGVVTSEMRDFLASVAPLFPKVIFWADSRRNIRLFRNIHIKPNQFEAVGRLNPLPGDELSISALKSAIQRLRSEAQAPVFLTYGERGIIVSDPEPTLIPTFRVSGPIDPTGAGDSATAGAVLALASGATYAEAALVANLVASITVRQLGTTGCATPDDVLAALQMWTEQNARPVLEP